MSARRELSRAFGRHRSGSARFFARARRRGPALARGADLPVERAVGPAPAYYRQRGHRSKWRPDETTGSGAAPTVGRALVGDVLSSVFRDSTNHVDFSRQQHSGHPPLPRVPSPVVLYLVLVFTPSSFPRLPYYPPLPSLSIPKQAFKTPQKRRNMRCWFRRVEYFVNDVFKHCMI